MQYLGKRSEMEIEMLILYWEFLVFMNWSEVIILMQNFIICFPFFPHGIDRITLGYLSVKLWQYLYYDYSCSLGATVNTKYMTHSYPWIICKAYKTYVPPCQFTFWESLFQWISGKINDNVHCVNAHMKPLIYKATNSNKELVKD